MSIITRTVTNNTSSGIELFIPGYNPSKPSVVIGASATVDLFTVITGDELEAIQDQLAKEVSEGHFTVMATVDTATFNPVGSSGGITALTGDVTASGTGSVAATVHSAGSGSGAFAAGAVTATSIKGSANPLIITSASDSTNGIDFQNGAGSIHALHVDTLNGRIGIQTNTPNLPLVVNGNASINGQLAMGPSTPSGACLIDMVNPFVGLGLPAMTTTQMNAITPRRAGNMIFNTTIPAVCYDDGTNWNQITATVL